MKTFTQIIFLLNALLFWSCEQTSNEEAFPYVPKLVIRGVIEAGKPANNIYIGRTLPVEEEFSASFANLTDAVAAIAVDGVFYPLKHVKDGVYSNDTLEIIEDKTYSLIVQWQNLYASATTTIPKLGQITDSKINVSNGSNERNYIETLIIPVNDESYTSTWVILDQFGSVINEGSEFYSVARSGSPGTVVTLRVQTSDIPNYYVTSELEKAVKIHIYDKSFYDYFVSQSPGQITDGVFGQSYSYIKWNIVGAGIGMFVGKQEVLKRLE